MFGYFVCNKNGLDENELKRYQEMYCGVCKSIRERYGQLEKMTLNYDMTFLAIFLSALYDTEDEDTPCEHRCIVHPFGKREYIRNKYTDYAADMTILLSYYKCLDDWNDEHKIISKKYGDILKKHMKTLEEKYPRQCNCVRESIEKLSVIEKDENSIVDKAINYGGKMLSELFVYKEDFWSDSLRTFGYNLGKYIYLCDAAVDYKIDQKKHTYNPIVKLGKKPEDMKEIMTLAIGDATKVFEDLPIVQDEHLIRNVLYSGVWQKYSIMYEKGDEKKDGR